MKVLLSRILEPPYFFVLVGVLVFTGHTISAINAWHGDKGSLVLLICFLFVWTALALYHSIKWKESNRGWHRALGAWGETNQLAKDYSRLLQEASDGLATYDREKSDDILERAATITMMRFQNIEEKLND